MKKLLHFTVQYKLPVSITGTMMEEEYEGWKMKHLSKVPKKFSLSPGLRKATLTFLWRKLL